VVFPASPTFPECGPTRADLARIEAEWPVIAAELEVTDAQCRLASSPGDVVAVRTNRRAVRRLLAVLAESGTPARPVVMPVLVPVVAA
jgi:hypothetical protein